MQNHLKYRKGNSFSISLTYLSLFVCVVTGFCEWAFGGADLAWQILILLHITAGFALSVATLRFVSVHLKYTLGFRSLGVTLSGWILCLVMLIVLGSGLWIVGVGQTEFLHMDLSLHRHGATVVLICLILHFLLYRARSTPSRLGAALFTSAGVSIAVFFAAVTLVFGYLGQTGSDIEEVTDKRDYELPYGDGRFAPSESRTQTGDFLAVSQIGNSGECASCHADISKQWLSSMHRHAARDPAYEKNIKLLVDKKGISAARYCEGCHAPIALLTGELTPGGRHGGVDNTPANDEGVSCLSCHAVDRVVHTLGNGSYEIGSLDDHLFRASESKIGKGLHNVLLRARPEVHIGDLGPELLGNAEFCASCHAQFMDETMNDWGWVKMQDEYTAWSDSPFSGKSVHNRNFSTSNCIDCHMPLVTAADPSADSQGKVRSHRFAAANTFVPTLEGDTEQFNEVVEFLTSNRVSVSVVLKDRESTVKHRVSVNESLRAENEVPNFVYLNETLELHVVVSNNRVGHDFPGGTVDINEAWVSLAVKDGTGQTVFQSGYLDSNGHVEPQAHFYKSVPLDRFGNHVWRHDLFNMTGDAYKRVLRSGKSDIVSFEFEIPLWAQSPLTVTAAMNYRKLNKRYTDWVLGENKEFPVVEMSSDSLLVPVKTRAPVIPGID